MSDCFCLCVSCRFLCLSLFVAVSVFAPCVGLGTQWEMGSAAVIVVHTLRIVMEFADGGDLKVLTAASPSQPLSAPPHQPSPPLSPSTSALSSSSQPLHIPPTADPSTAPSSTPAPPRSVCPLNVCLRLAVPPPSRFVLPAPHRWLCTLGVEA